MTGTEEANIRGLEIDKVIKAVTWTEYVFKSLCQVSSTKSDSIRWYNKTNAATTLSPTSPSTGSNISPLSKFQMLHSDVTRNTSYIRKYGYSDIISMEDVESSDIDILALTVMDLTRAVIRDVDSRIWDVLTNSRVTPTSATAGNQINMITTSGAWTSLAGDPLRDVLQAARAIAVSGGYSQTPTLVVSPTDYQNLIVWLAARGSNIPTMATDVTRGGRVLEIAGMPIRSSVNVTADYAVALIPQVACTWKSFTDTTSEVINHPGLGKEIRIWELGEAILTNPRAVCLISNTQ